MSPGTGPEKNRDARRWPRFVVEDEARVILHPEHVLNVVGLLKGNRAKTVINLSGGGVLVRVAKELPRGLSVRLKVDIPKFGDRFECSGEVKWCYPAAGNSGDYFAGVIFKDLSRGDCSKIEKLRSWFTSPEYKSRTRFRKKSEGLVFPR